MGRRECRRERVRGKGRVEYHGAAAAAGEDPDGGAGDKHCWLLGTAVGICVCSPAALVRGIQHTPKGRMGSCGYQTASWRRGRVGSNRTDALSTRAEPEGGTNRNLALHNCCWCWMN